MGGKFALARAAVAVLLLAGCAEKSLADAPASSGLPPVWPPVSARNVVVVTRDYKVEVASPTGAVTRNLGPLKLLARPDAYENPRSLDVSPDGTHILLGTFVNGDHQCRVRTYAIGASGGQRVVLDGSGATFSPDGTKLAYLKYAVVDRFCRSTRLVVRDVATGAERSHPLADGPFLDSLPPTFPLNWSPDGTRVVYVGAALASIATVVGPWTDQALRRPVDSNGDAPIFLDNRTVAAMTNCCTLQSQLRRFPIGGSGSSLLFKTVGPVRSIHPDRGGAGFWYTTELAPTYTLWHWAGGRLRHLPNDVLLSSG